jgi:hypothetical protein
MQHRRKKQCLQKNGIIVSRPHPNAKKLAALGLAPVTQGKQHLKVQLCFIVRFPRKKIAFADLLFNFFNSIEAA